MAPTLKNYKQTRAGILIILLFAAAVLFLCSVFLGSVSLSVSELLARDGEAAVIFFELRLPRSLAAMLLGAALAVSGFLLQTFFSNPLAGPFVLGVSSGARLFMAIAMILLLGQGRYLSSWGMTGAAFFGAMLSILFVLLVSHRTMRNDILIICGVMVGYFCQSLTEFFITFAGDSQVVNLHGWSQGSFSGITMENVSVIAVVLGIAMTGCVLLVKPIGAYEMGEDAAAGMGINVRLLKVLMLLLAGVLAAVVAAFAGPVAFVGIAVPQMLIPILRTKDPKWMLPACMLGGAAFCLLCDLLARMLFAPTELSISIVTAIFGAPVVIWVMIGRHRGRRQDGRS